jgi:hypothetical protein
MRSESFHQHICCFRREIIAILSFEINLARNVFLRAPAKPQGAVGVIGIGGAAIRARYWLGM